MIAADLYTAKLVKDYAPSVKLCASSFLDIYNSAQIIDSVVVVPYKVNNKFILCAFYSCTSDIDINDLKSLAATKLPNYMIPSKYIKISKIPLTANGKVDKKQLMLPLQKEDCVIEEPKSKTEEEVARIWQRELEIDKISVCEDYYELGGDSIQMLIIISEVERKFGIKLSFSDVLHGLTIRKISFVIDQLIEDKNRKRVSVNIINSDMKVKFFMFPDVMGVGYIQKDMISACGKYGAKLYDLDYYEGGSELIERYTEDVLHSKRADSIILGGYSLGGNLAFEVAKRLENHGIIIERLVLVDSYFVKSNYKMNNRNEIGEYIDFMVHLHSNEGTKDNIRLRAAKVFDFFAGMNTIGDIEADILYIQSEADEEFTKNMRSFNHEWGFCTNGNFVLRQGYGRHVDMMKKANAAANGKILREYLDINKIELNV